MDSDERGDQSPGLTQNVPYGDLNRRLKFSDLESREAVLYVAKTKVLVDSSPEHCVANRRYKNTTCIIRVWFGLTVP